MRGCEPPGLREGDEMWWGLMVANTNKICGFGMELAAGSLRLLSLPVWGLLWHGGYLGSNLLHSYAAIPSSGNFPEHLKPPGPSL
jgi:hypothetical protein